jgi:hypothetical protein
VHRVADQVLARGHEQRATVGGEAEGRHGPAGVEAQELAPGSHVPQDDEAVLAAAGEQVAVGGERDAGGPPLVAAERLHGSAGLAPEQEDLAGRARRREVLTGGAPGQPDETVGGAEEAGGRERGLHGPAPDLAVPGGRVEPERVAAERHGRELLAVREHGELPARGHVPQPRPLVPPGGGEQRAVAGNGQRPDLAVVAAQLADEPRGG